MDSKDLKAALSITSISVMRTISLKASSIDMSLMMIPSSQASLANEMEKAMEVLLVVEALEALASVEDLSLTVILFSVI